MSTEIIDQVKRSVRRAAQRTGPLPSLPDHGIPPRDPTSLRSPHERVFPTTHKSDQNPIFFRWSSLGRAKYIDPDWQFLSNMSPFGFSLDGLEYPSMEHYFHVQKYILGRAQPLKFSPPEAACRDPVIRQILTIVDPFELKRQMGARGSLSSCFHFDPVAWQRVRPDVVARGIREKTRQNLGIARLLLESGDRFLAERALSHRKSTPPSEDELSGAIVQWHGQWYGRNSLGIAWMKLRDELREAATSN
jgi:predicted NAD-dependent protein-ADP-ribosyltransferase YbiA (DUF1768 family)